MTDAPTDTGFRRRASDRQAGSATALVPTGALDAGRHGAINGAIDGAIDAVPLRSARHDPSFVTHLIAIAERCPQTRVLRRASPADAMAAYRSSDARSHTLPPCGSTRHIV